jgi:hypothetical protein
LAAAEPAPNYPNTLFTTIEYVSRQISDYENTGYKHNNYQYVEETFKKYNAITVVFKIVPSGHTDLYTQANKPKQVKPDLVAACFVAVASGAAYCKQTGEWSCARISILLISVPQN